MSITKEWKQGASIGYQLKFPYAITDVDIASYIRNRRQEKVGEFVVRKVDDNTIHLLLQDNQLSVGAYFVDWRAQKAGWTSYNEGEIHFNVVRAITRDD